MVQAYGLTCRRCGEPIDPLLSGLHPRGLTIGHVIPARAGGRAELANVRPEHRACNLAERPAVSPRARVVPAPARDA
jgi:5-methylcytosine-specific restriction endonuclease McrA